MPVPRWASVYLHQGQGEAPVRLDAHGWAWPLLCVWCSLVIDEIPEVPIVVAVGVELETDDTVTVGVDHREDRLRVRIERELLVRVGAVAVQVPTGVSAFADAAPSMTASTGLVMATTRAGATLKGFIRDSFRRARFVALTSDCGAILPWHSRNARDHRHHVWSDRQPGSQDAVRNDRNCRRAAGAVTSILVCGRLALSTRATLVAAPPPGRSP
jgi:hypothetical protein